MMCNFLITSIFLTVYENDSVDVQTNNQIFKQLTI